MSESQTNRWQTYEPCDGSEEDVQALRALLAEYTEEAICRRLQIPNLAAYTVTPAEQLEDCPIETPLDALIRLFFECMYIHLDDLPPETLALLDRLGFVASDTMLAGAIYATVAILRVDGELNVCDRGGSPDGSPYPLPPDVVYPPVFENTRTYLASLPTALCDAMLEIGTGTGIGAILGARHAGHVWASDVTSRAVHFAALSCRLAGVDNVTVVQGDLYGPVEGLSFDRIAIHPPWVPARQSKFVFGDGGEDGETIIRRTIEGLPQFLRPGGRFYAMLLASDREGEAFEERVRRWLGATHEQFNIAFAVVSRESTHGFLVQNLAKGSIGEADIGFWKELWRATSTEAMVYGQLIVQRHEEEREAVTRRVRAGREYSGRHLERLMDWESFVRTPGAVEKLLESRPLLSPHCTLKTNSRPENGRFVTEAMALDCAGPIRVLFPCEAWLPQVVCRCDGAQTWRELFTWASTGGIIAETVSAEEFAGVLASLVRSGFLTV